MKKIFISCSLAVITLAQAFNVAAQDNRQGVKLNAAAPEIQTTPLRGVVDLANTSQLTPVMFSEKIEHPETDAGVLPEDAVLPEVSSSRSSLSKKDVEEPVVFKSIVGFSDNQFTPPDNTIAVGDDGTIVSAMNSHYRIFDPSGKVLAVSSYNNLLKKDLPNLTDTYYDPRVIYDPESDRFIMVILHGNQSYESYIAIMFSKTSDPLDGWNVYALKGDVFGKNYWTDYPNIGLSKKDLYITGNLFSNGRSFRETFILQIDKNKGYTGDANLSYRSWGSIRNENNIPIFTLVPASYGLDANYGPGMKFVAHDITSGNKLYYLDLDKDLSAADASLTRYVVSYPFSYQSPSIAFQKGQNDYLNAGDARIKQAFFLNNTIHYVFSSRNAQSFSSVVYGRLNVNDMSLDYRTLGATGLSYCYPSIASLALNNQPEDRTAMIGFLRAGQTMYPELALVTCDDNFEFSNTVTVQAGVTGVNILSSENTERWGDYSGMARRYNTNRCVFAGAFGAGSNWQTRIADAGLESTNISSVKEAPEAAAQNVVVYPNPVVDNYSISFDLEESAKVTIKVMDLQGRQAEVLYGGWQAEGKKVFTFNKAALAKGVYMLTIEADNKAMITKQIVVQ